MPFLSPALLSGLGVIDQGSRGSESAGASAGGGDSDVLVSLREILRCLEDSAVRSVATGDPLRDLRSQRIKPCPLPVGQSGSVAATQMDVDTSEAIALAGEKAKDGATVLDKVRLADSAKCKVYVCFEGPLGAHLIQEVRLEGGVCGDIIPATAGKIQSG